MSEEIRKVQHYHTKTANAKPSATNMLDGEIAVNMTADNEKLFIKNTDNEIVEFLPADKLATKTELSGKMDKVTLATVATSGSYNDLSNKPTIPTKTSDLTNDNNFGKVATFEWDGATMSGTLSQDKYNEIAAANIVYIKIGDNITQFNKDVNEAGVIELSLTTFGEPFPVIGETSFTINTNRDYTVSTNFIDIPTKSSDLDDGANLLKSDNIKTVNGEGLVIGADGVTDIKTQLAYAEYTGTATAAEVTTKYGYFPTTLVEGASVAVKFEGSLTYITTLNVNGTGAKNVYYKGNSLSSGTINRYNTYLFVYDGSYYRIVGIDTDTHYTAKNVVTSSSTSKSNATATNGNVRLNLIENSAVRSTHKIVGTGATTVTSDSSGNITIDTPLKTINGESIVGSGDITIEGGGGGNVYTWSVPADVTTGTVTPEEYAAIKEASQVYIEREGVSYQASKIDVGTQGMVALSVIIGMGDDSGNSLIYGLYFEIDPSFSFSNNTFIMSNPTKTSQLTNDSNFVTYAEFEWDGSSEGTVTQAKFEELRNADIVIVKQQDGDIIAHACKTSGGAVIFYYSTTMDNIISSAMFIVMDHDCSWTCSTSQTTIPAAVTEATVSGWGFTKNTGTITEVKANGTSLGTSGSVNIPSATTAVYGVTKLSSATNSSDETTAATPKAVKSAYDLANGKYTKPSGGITKTDLASDIKTSLGKADTALQSIMINGSTKNPSNGIVDLGTVITSHQTLKTINNQSIIGSGNIEISGGSGSSEANVKAVDIDENLDDVEEIDSNVKPYILTTYAELCNLRNNSALIPGVWYRITDYVTTTSQENTTSAGHKFDVIVTAIDSSTLSEDAKATWNERESYFYGSDLNSWEIKYALNHTDEDTKFAWGGNTSEELYTTQGYTYDSSACTIKPELINDRSFITPLRFESCLWSDTAGGTVDGYVDGNSNHDEGEPIYEWDYYYDSNGAGHLCLYKSDEGMYEEEGQPDYGDKYLYRGVTTIDGTEYDYWQKIEEKEGKDTLYFYGNATVFATTARIVANPEDCIITPTNIVASTRVQVAPKGVIYYMKDEFGNECPYDFKNIMFIRYKLNSPEDTPVHNAIVDKKLECIRSNFDDNCLSYVWGGVDRNANKIWEEGNECQIISKPTGEYEAFYTFAQVNSDGTIHDASLNRSGDARCCNNIINSYKLNNGYASYALNNNIFLQNGLERVICRHNTIKYDCCNNTFGANAFANLLSDGSTRNIFGDFNGYMTIGNICGNNYFGSRCENDNLGIFCNYNFFGNDCRDNLLGIECGNNVFGEGSCRNTMGGMSAFNALGNHSQCNIFEKECCNNLFTTHATPESSLIPCSNIHVGTYCSDNIIYASDYVEDNTILMNINIKSGVYGAHIIVDANDKGKETIVAKNSKGEIKVYCEADLIG